MNSIERNDIFMDNVGMIRRVMRRNWALICAMRLDWDDVYQELAMAALNAIETFDPARSECIQAHIWMKLQYAVLTIKRQHRPAVSLALAISSGLSSCPWINRRGWTGS